MAKKTMASFDAVKPAITAAFENNPQRVFRQAELAEILRQDTDKWQLARYALRSPKGCLDGARGEAP
jgi:hypothetical protein